MSYRLRTASVLLSFALLFSAAASFIAPRRAFASESDRIKAITVYTSFYMSSLRSSYKSDVGIDTLVTPVEAKGYSITWKSSNKDVATVDSNGHVHGKLTGKYADKDEAACTITATVTLNGMTSSDSVRVNVKRGRDPYQSYLTEMSANGLIASFDASYSNKAIRALIKEHDASCESITKTSNDEKIVLISVDEDASDNDTAGIAAELEEEGSVSYVQPNFQYKLADTDEYYHDIALKEDGSFDYDSLNQYYHFRSGFSDAWDLLSSRRSGDSPGTTVAVIDSGVDTSQLDLVSADGNTNLILNDGKYTSFRNNVKDTQETNDMSWEGHGTHVTGIIGALYGNSCGGAGAASGRDNDLAKVLVVGATKDRRGNLDTYDIIKAIDYAGENGAKVINMSFGGESYDRALDDIISKWYGEGVVFVASGGNDNSDYRNDPYSICYPADLKEVIGVCNIGPDGKKNKSSNYGFAKDISAPGTEIWSTAPTNKMACLTGTSMAAPVVSSACALILDADPSLSPLEVRNILCGTASDPDGYYLRHELGCGSLDAYEAVKKAFDAKDSSPGPVSITIKKPYRSKEDTIEKSVVRTAALSNLTGISVQGENKSVSIGFKGSKCTLSTDHKTKIIDAYTGKAIKTTHDITEKLITTGIKYKVGVKEKGGSWKYYVLPDSDKNTSSYSVKAEENRFSVKIKRLKKGRTYYVRLRPCRKLYGKNWYGKWSSKRTVEVK